MKVKFFFPRPKYSCDRCEREADIGVDISYTRTGRFGQRDHECVRRRFLCRFHAARYAKWKGYPFDKDDVPF